MHHSHPRYQSGTAALAGDNVYDFTYEWDGDVPLSTWLVETVESLDDGLQSDGQTLFERIDPDSLDHLFRCVGDWGPRDEGVVSFPFSGFHVTVEAGGVVRIERAEVTDGH